MLLHPFASLPNLRRKNWIFLFKNSCVLYYLYLIKLHLPRAPKNVRQKCNFFFNFSDLTQSFDLFGRDVQQSRPLLEAFREQFNQEEEKLF